MGSRRQAVSARAERRAIVALVAVFALLAQALFPSLALAASPNRESGVICSAGLAAPGHGGDSSPQNHTGGGCDHCVCPIAAASAPCANDLSQAAIRYSVVTKHDDSGADVCAPGRGLAAPPPPSRGPPELTV